MSNKGSRRGRHQRRQGDNGDQSTQQRKYKDIVHVYYFAMRIIAMHQL